MIVLPISRRQFGVLGLAVFIGVGGTAYYALASGLLLGNKASNLSSGGGVLSNSSPTVPAYDCAKPAANSQNFCDQLPTGYQIAPRLPNGPQAYCRSGMTASACALLKQTFANGICDPNETVWTDPLDCGCSGALIGDPFTGRCGAPATVCQLQLVQQAQQSQR